jgi:ribokinase
LYCEDVGFLTRTGADLDESNLRELHGLGANLDGWRQYPHLETPRLDIAYDDDQNMLNAKGEPMQVMRWEGNWSKLLAQEIEWPASYRSARAVHLITELPKEQMVEAALQWKRATGGLLSLEPLFDKNQWHNRNDMMELVRHVDVVCPDAGTACKMAETDDPRAAAAHWHGLGPTWVALRAGAVGSYIAGAGLDAPMHIPAMNVDVQDPTGAGNAYAGGLAAALIDDPNLSMAACKATAAAAVMLGDVGIPAFSEQAARDAHTMAKAHYESFVEQA